MSFHYILVYFSIYLFIDMHWGDLFCGAVR